MEFFERIYPVIESGKLTITMVISKPVHGKIAVSVLPKQTDEKADKIEVKPLVISGTPKELDEGFINELTRAGRSTHGLMSSIDEYNDLVEKQKRAVVKKTDKTVKKKAAPVKTPGAVSQQPGLFT